MTKILFAILMGALLVLPAAAQSAVSATVSGMATVTWKDSTGEHSRYIYTLYLNNETLVKQQITKDAEETAPKGANYSVSDISYSYSRGNHVTGGAATVPTKPYPSIYDNH